MPSLRIHVDNKNSIHFITLTTVAWIDVFTSEQYFQLLLNSLLYCQKNKGLLLYEYVFMTNHIHLIIAVKEEYSLSQTISDFKKYTTYEILRLIKEDNRKYLLWILENSFQKKKGSTLHLWQQNNYPEVIETEKFYKEKQEYIYNNPVKKGFVEKPEHWKYSSARNRLFDDHELIKVEEV